PCAAGQRGAAVPAAGPPPSSICRHPPPASRSNCGSCASDSSTASLGWYVDSVALSNLVCCSGTTVDLALGGSVSPALMNLSSNVTFTLNVTNLGPNSASSVVVTDAI